MNNLYYIIILIGAIMVYGSGPILKLLKLDDNIKMMIILKFAGLAVAIIGMLKIFKVI